MNPERGPPYSLLSRASIFLLFPSSLRPLPIYSLPLCVYTSVPVCHVLNNVCVCVRARAHARVLEVYVCRCMCVVGIVFRFYIRIARVGQLI